MHECRAKASGKLSLVNTLLLPIFGQSLLPAIKSQSWIFFAKGHVLLELAKIQRRFNRGFWQKVSHRVYTLQDAYLGRTLTTPVKNAMKVNRSSFMIANSSWGRWRQGSLIVIICTLVSCCYFDVPAVSSSYLFLGRYWKSLLWWWLPTWNLTSGCSLQMLCVLWLSTSPSSLSLVELVPSPWGLQGCSRIGSSLVSLPSSSRIPSSQSSISWVTVLVFTLLPILFYYQLPIAGCAFLDYELGTLNTWFCVTLKLVYHMLIRVVFMTSHVAPSVMWYPL